MRYINVESFIVFEDVKDSLLLIILDFALELNALVSRLALKLAANLLAGAEIFIDGEHFVARIDSLTHTLALRCITLQLVLRTLLIV